MNCTIKYKGKEYSSIDSLPSELRTRASELYKNLKDKEGGVINLEGTYYSLNLNDLEVYHKQLTENSTEAQKSAAETIIAHSKKASLHANEKEYQVAGHDKPLTRTTNFLKSIKNGFYGYSQDVGEDKYEVNRQWGNLIDNVLELVIEDNPNIEEEINNIVLNLNSQGLSIGITLEALNNVINSFKELKAKYPDSILLSQSVLHNTSVNIAGTTDLLIIHPDGTVDILDLKTSKEPVYGTFEKINEKGLPTTTWYGKSYNYKGESKSSKSQRHQAQLSIYKALLESQGLKVNKIGILPMHILNTDENGIITDITQEDIKWHKPEDSLVKVLKTSNSTKDAMDALESQYVSPTLFEGLLTALTNQVKLLQSNEEYIQARKINEVKEKIELLNTVTNVSEVIDALHDLFLGEFGQFRNFKNLLDDIESGVYSNLDDIFYKLNIYKKETNIYKKIFGELSSELMVESLENPEIDSALSKLSKVISATDAINTLYEKRVNPLLAQKLTEQIGYDNEEAIKKANAEIKKLTNKNEALLKERETASPRRIKRIDRAIRHNKETIQKYKLVDKSNMYQDVLTQLEQGSWKDVSLIESQIMAPIMSSNTILKTFMMTLKDAFQSIYPKLFRLEKQASQVFEEFLKVKGDSNNVAKFNEDIIEKSINYRGEENYYFVNPLNYSAFSKDKKEISEEVENYNKENTKNKNVYQVYFERGLTVTRPNEDITLENPVTGEVIVLTKGLDTVIKEAKESMTEAQFQKWKALNTRTVNGKIQYYGKDVTMPNMDKYKNSKYESLKQNKAAFKYYKYFLSTYLKAQEKTPNKLFYKLPQIEKNSNDRLREKGVKNWFGRFYEKNTKILEEEENEYGTSSGKIVPMLYTTDIGVDNVSLDVASSVLRFVQASEQYKVNYKLREFSEALLDTVKSTQPMGDENTNSIKSLEKLPGFNKLLNKHNGNNVAAALESLIDVHIYGKRRLKQEIDILGFKVSVNKIVDGLMGFASFTQIGGDPVLAVANSITANTSARLDAFGNKHFGLKNWEKAGMMYTQNEGNFLNDMFSPVKKSKIGQMVELYDVLQGEYYDEYGRKLSHQKLKRMWSSKTWFSGMHKGEHRAQVKTMLAIMENNKVLNAKGEQVSMYEAYDIINNELTIKPGFTDLNGNQLPLVNPKIRNTIHNLSRQAQGVYNNMDKTLVERTNMGMMLMMYKKFIVPGVMRRFRSSQYDIELEDVTEGYFRTFFRTLMNERNELINHFLGKQTELTEFEKENLNKTIGEITTMIVLTSIAALLTAMVKAVDDDDEELKMALQYPLYFSLRASSELSFFNMGLGDVRRAGLPVNPGGTLKSFRTPFALFSTMTKSIDLGDDVVKLIIGSEDAYYKRNAKYYVPFVGNIAEKGDPKAVVRVAKLLGLADKLGNIENATNIMKQFN